MASTKPSFQTSSPITAAYVILTAAGQGTRLGWDRPKALVPVAGVPLLVRAVAGINQWAVQADAPPVFGVVTAPADLVAEFQSLLNQTSVLFPPFENSFACQQLIEQPSVKQPAIDWLVVPGGDSRQASVYAGLKALPAADSSQAAVLIHDAARCLTPAGLFQEVFQAIAAGVPAVVPALPVADTIRELADPTVKDTPLFTPDAPVSSQDTATDLSLAGQTLNRERLRAVQTPQGFRGDLIFAAHREFSNQPSAATWDDALLVSALGYPHYFIPGQEAALKITTAHDLKLAEFLATKV